MITEIGPRFWKYVRKGDGCWEWTGSKTPLGYGQFSIKNRCKLAHRVSYMLTFGEYPPKGLDTDHLCRNPSCVRPDHMEIVTHRENLMRGVKGMSRRTHCPQGHPYDEINTRVYYGRRFCHTCRIDKQRRRRAAQRSAA